MPAAWRTFSPLTKHGLYVSKVGVTRNSPGVVAELVALGAGIDEPDLVARRAGVGASAAVDGVADDVDVAGAAGGRSGSYITQYGVISKVIYFT